MTGLVLAGLVRWISGRESEPRGSWLRNAERDAVACLKALAVIMDMAGVALKFVRLAGTSCGCGPGMYGRAFTNAEMFVVTAPTGSGICIVNGLKY